MSTFRRSGSSVLHFFAGDLPDPRSDAFRAALEQHRFRTIESAANEEVSVGWVTRGDPTGDSFDPTDMDGGQAIWLRMRVDRKVLPRQWLAIHRAVAERARGRRLSVRERRELKDDLMDKLLPRILPSVQLVDVLLFVERRMLMLLSGAKGHRETFGKLFFRTFGLPLVAGDPLQRALRAGLDRDQLAQLERVRPVPWPQRSNGRRDAGGSGPAAEQVAQEIES